MAPELERLGLLSVLDGDVLAAYCATWASFSWATRALAKHGRMMRTLSGRFTAHPAVAIQDVALKNLRCFGELLGLSLAWRSRMSISVANEEVSELERFLAEGKARSGAGTCRSPEAISVKSAEACFE